MGPFSQKAQISAHFNRISANQNAEISFLVEPSKAHFCQIIRVFCYSSTKIKKGVVEFWHIKWRMSLVYPGSFHQRMPLKQQGISYIWELKATNQPVAIVPPN